MIRILLILLVPATLWGGSVLPLRLDDLSRLSGKIFAGSCLGTVRELDENRIPSLYLRVRVTDAVRGIETGPALWKQYDGSPACREGESLVWFLYPESAIGFTSPVGLGQGRFFIETDAEGRRWVVSPFPHLNEDLGPLESFLESIRRDR